MVSELLPLVSLLSQVVQPRTMRTSPSALSAPGKLPVIQDYANTDSLSTGLLRLLCLDCWVAYYTLACALNAGKIIKVREKSCSPESKPLALGRCLGLECKGCRQKS